MPSFGPFELAKRLGAGTSAEVYLATGPNAAAVELFALKTFLPHIAPDERTRKALLKDLEPARRLRHPSIVEVYETGEQEGRVYIAMEPVRGQPVGAVVRKMREAGKALSLAEAAFVVSQAAAALDAAFETENAEGKPQALLHRDVSPQNLLVSAQGEVKLTDFGVARTVFAAAQVSGAMRAKLPYLSPEQLEKRPVDRRSDVFSLGTVLWELLTGQRLFNAKSEEELVDQLLRKPIQRIDRVMPSLPREVADILEQALERDRERRVPAAGVLADVLQPFTTPETQKKLGSRIDTLFGPFLETFDEVKPRGKRSSRSMPAMKAPAKSATGEKPKGPASRAVVPITADATMRDVKAAPPPAARRPSGPKPEADPELDPDRAIVVHPLLAARPARRRAKLDLPDDDGVDHRIGYSEGTVSRLLRLNHPKPKKWAPVVGVLGATLLIVLAILAYTRVGVSRLPTPALTPQEPTEQPSPPESASREEPPRETPRPTKGTVQIQSDVPAFVRQGGKDLGMTPVTLTLPAGRARFELRTPDGTLSTQVTVQVPAGGETTRMVQLKR